MRRLMLAVAVVTALLATVATPAGAAYAGGDGRLAFVRAKQIYTVTPAGGAVKQLTYAGRNVRPKWSPNGKRIAYVHETATGAKDVWVMAANGSNKQQVTRVGNVTAAPSWSPDGRWLAFASGPLSAYADLQRINLTTETMAERYSVLIEITPAKLLAW